MKSLSNTSKLIPTATHWGNFLIEVDGEDVIEVHSYPEDEAPSPIGKSLLEYNDRKTRIAKPSVRKSYLENGWESDGTLRGKEAFVEVDWETAFSLAARSLEHVRAEYGNEAIYGGSYGWSSAGRFHHAQSQIHRFLNQIGGYVGSRDTYSVSAGARILPHVIGMTSNQIQVQAPSCKEMAEHTELLVCFGGIAMKNTEVNHGGIGNHYAKSEIDRLIQGDIKFVNISPVRDDIATETKADWIPVIPQSDTALMLALAHVIYSEGLADAEFLKKYTVGFDKFARYLTGEDDNIPKNAEWAEKLTGIPSKQIAALAREMASSRTVITVSLSLQRAEHGEQPWWMAIILSAMLGQIGLPGAGTAFGYGSIHSYGFYGRNPRKFRAGSFPQGKNPVSKFIPVSRISDMLLNPGEMIDYDGQAITFPDIELIYWAGGNPFHHHQDINRLRKAWSKPGTVIVNEAFWNPLARHADIVFPATTTLERNDFAISVIDTWITPMLKAAPAYGQSRNDFDIFSGIARHMGCEGGFNEGLSEIEWVERLYNQTRANAKSTNVNLPSFQKFWSGQQINIADQLPAVEFKLEKFRTNPEQFPLDTPSGKIEIFSETIESFGYDDCRGHPRWFDKQEWLGSERAKKYPFHVISNQPKGKLHSQFDHASASRKTKIKNREIVTMNPNDATAVGVKKGDIVRIFNDRGSCLAGVKISESLRPSVVELPTGSWYDPENADEEISHCVHGNPNTLTKDIGTSRLAQGPSAHSCLADIEKYEGELPPVQVFDQPELAKPA
ncbi:MAG: molybdopterin-dependent oxidoreductase [Sphingorhabdus sp.]